MAWALMNFGRMGVMGAVTLFSFICLALSAHITYITTSERARLADFQGLSIAASVLTLVSVPVFLVVGFLRKGSFMTMNVVEVPVCAFLAVLWMANGILMSQWASVIGYAEVGCGWAGWTRGQSGFCSEFTAVEAFSFLNWILLFAYIAFVIVVCLIGKSRGNNVWLVGANDAEYFAHNKQNNNHMMTPPQQMHQPQYTGQMQQQPQFTGQPQHQQQQMMQQPQYQPQQIQQQGQMMYNSAGTPPVQGYSPAPVHAQV
ncbi:hypothetical protein AAF712_014401 [Marasmius tenuissimus]|uniref:MARVEL domain-containing protein n=1 Tax=Marasmius tenuissimus TaxID=585030 RepID=A0ABR2ZC76_9AGAR